MRIAELPPRWDRGWKSARMMLMTACLFVAPPLFCFGAEKAAVVTHEANGPILLKRESADKPWQLAKEKDVLTVGEQISGGVGAAIESADGSVRAFMRGDVAGLSPFPILETALTLEEPKDVDFAFEIDRGRIDLINRKAKGAAKIKMTIRGQSGVITLPEPGDRVAVEIYGRWAKGVPFTKKPKETDVPVLTLLIIAVKGDIEIKGPNHSFSLKAPPGPALLMINDIMDPAPIVESLEKEPEWVRAKDPEKQKKVAAATTKFKMLAASKSIPEALKELGESDDPSERRAAVIIMGATDNLKELSELLMTTKHPDVWENSVIVLRHWIGRAPGQDLKLYTGLIEKGKMPPADAEIVLQLLHSFSDAERRKPGLYQALIDYLDNDRLEIRGLAHWHLVRLVPDGRKIDYNINGTKEDRAKSVKAWHELIPPGSLPGQAKNKK